MEFLRKEPIIFLVAGKARSGKSSVAAIIENSISNTGKKVITTQITKYLKMYIEEIIGNKIDDDNKPRDLLQKISSDLIKDKLNMPNFFRDRLIQDLNIYSYFFDCIIISDIRFIEEIEVVKNNFSNVISIGVVRENFVSDLTEEQQNDITEISLDNYDDYDYKIINDEKNDLCLEVKKILKNI